MAENSAKGNPASHRMSNANRKASYGQAWTRGQKRKDARRAAQKLREKANILLLDSEKPTPWQEAKLARKERRDRDPFVLRKRRLHLADALKAPTGDEPRRG